MRCKEENHLVLLHKKKADNTDIKQYNFIVQTGNKKHKKNKNKNIKHKHKPTWLKKTLEMQGITMFSIVWNKKQNKNKSITKEKHTKNNANIKQKSRNIEHENKNKSNRKNAKNESKLVLKMGTLGKFVSKKQANINKGKGQKKEKKPR